MGEKDDIFAIAWCLATFAEINYSKNCDPRNNKDTNLKIYLTHNFKTFEFINKQQFNSTHKLIHSLISP